MGSCYSDDHTAGDHMHTDITTTYNKEEQQQKYCIETVSNRLWGRVALNMFYLAQTSPSAPAQVQNI